MWFVPGKMGFATPGGRSPRRQQSLSSVIIIVVTHRHHRRSPHSRVSCMLVLACMHASMHALVHAGRQVGTVSPGTGGGEEGPCPDPFRATQHRSAQRLKTIPFHTAQLSTTARHDQHTGATCIGCCCCCATTPRGPARHATLHLPVIASHPHSTEEKQNQIKTTNHKGNGYKQ